MFYAFSLLREASKQDDYDNYLLVSNYLREIIKEEPNKSEAYYYLGFLYENGYGVD